MAEAVPLEEEPEVVCTEDEFCPCDDCVEARADEEFEEYNDDYSGEEVWDNYIEFVNSIKKAGFEEIDEGSFRVVYARNNIVIKIPMNEDGEIDNRVEAAVWRKYKSNPTDRGLYLAPCRLLPNGCLMMGKCNFDYTSEESDQRWSSGHWSKNVDNYQVGKYHGRIVAYDYALNVSERMDLEEEWGVHGHVFRNRFL